VETGIQSTYVAHTMSLTNSSAFIGCMFLNASGPTLTSWHTRSYMAVHRRNYVADLLSRQELCSSCSDCLIQPPIHRSTVGSQAFLVVGSLPATRGYVGTVSGNFLLLTLCFCSLSHILTFGSSDIFVSTHCL